MSDTFPDGYHLYRDADGALHLALKMGGSVVQLEPSDGDEKLRLGFYDMNFDYLDPQPEMSKG